MKDIKDYNMLYMGSFVAAIVLLASVNSSIS